MRQKRLIAYSKGATLLTLFPEALSLETDYEHLNTGCDMLSYELGKLVNWQTAAQLPCRMSDIFRLGFTPGLSSIRSDREEKSASDTSPHPSHGLS